MTKMIHKLMPAVPFALLLALVWTPPALPVASKTRGPWVLTSLPAIGTVTWRCQPVQHGELLAVGFRAFADSATDRLELRAAAARSWIDWCSRVRLFACRT